MSNLEDALSHLAFMIDNQKPKYRIKWDYDDNGTVTGYWVFTCNFAATQLKTSFYMNL